MTDVETSLKPVKLTFVKSKRESGFTLIEVMVALAILAVVAVAASRASSAYLSSVDILRTQTLAQFVAQNTAADLRIQNTSLTANRTQTMSAQGRDWQVVTTFKSGITPEFKEVTISVAPIIDGTTGAAVTDINIIMAENEKGQGDLNSGQTRGQL